MNLRKIVIVTVSIPLLGAAVSAESLFVDFESGIPADWKSSGVTVKSNNGSNRAAMSAGATLESPAVAGMTSVSYLHRGSGSNKELVVELSTDGGASWTKIGSTNVSSASTYGSSYHVTGASTTDDCIIRFTAMSATIFVDDVDITYVNSAAEPDEQASVAVTGVAGSTVDLDISAGDGEGRLVAWCEGSGMTWEPTDGIAFREPYPRKDGDAVIVASGDVHSLTVNGLVPGKQYTFAAWEYNGEGESRNYNTSGVTPVSITTLQVPVITATPSIIDFYNTKTGGYKDRAVELLGSYLEPDEGIITVTADCDAVTFATSADGPFTGAISIGYTGSALDTGIYVRFAPAEKKSYVASLNVTGGGADCQLTVKGKGADDDSREIFIAPDGDDNGAGTAEEPWLNLQKAVNAARPGDIIYCRGGRYHFTTRDSSGKLTVRIKNSGTPDAPITIKAYGDEQPIFDFEQQLLDCNRDRSKVGDRGILLTGNYWHLYGLHITHAADNGMKLEGSHNRIERCEFSYNLDSGLQLGFGHDFSASGFGSKNDGSYCAYNDIIDCDSHHNCDYDANYGSDADGFACKMHNGMGNRFIRCRAWRNSDDAWDLYETDYSVALIECWAWESGKAEDHTWVYDYFDKGPGFSGNGNGIKLGGNGSGGSSQGVHYAYNCIAFGNNKSGSTKGFDCNSHKGGHVVIGGLAFDNGYDFMFESGGGANSEFYNNVCFGRQEILVGTESHNALGGMTPQAGKTFVNNVVTQFSRSDYESLSEADALAPRGDDGSLPDKFGRLRSGSKLVDAGIDKPVPYTDEFSFLLQPIFGASRDMGPYELREGNMQSGIQAIMTHEVSDSFKVSTSRGRELVLGISVAEPDDVFVTVHSVTGVEKILVSTGRLESGVEYSIPLATDGLVPGVYVVTAVIDGCHHSRKVLIY